MRGRPRRQLHRFAGAGGGRHTQPYPPRPHAVDSNDQANLLFENLTDLVNTLRSYLEGIEFNPKRLDQVEERLNLIHNLKRKYGYDIPAVLSFAEEARRQRDTITNASERIVELEIKRKRFY